jgi:F-type H+-transporting ATPase subunit a
VANDPLSQFQIKPIVDMFSVGGMEFSFTNSSLFMVAAAGTIGALLFAASRSAQLVPSRMQSFGELWYEFVANMVRQVMGNEG